MRGKEIYKYNPAQCSRDELEALHKMIACARKEGR